MVGVYLHLQNCDSLKDPDMIKLMNRIEKILYSQLSIHQMEKLEELYNNKIDVIS